MQSHAKLVAGSCLGIVYLLLQLSFLQLMPGFFYHPNQGCAVCGGWGNAWQVVGWGAACSHTACLPPLPVLEPTALPESLLTWVVVVG